MLTMISPLHNIFHGRLERVKELHQSLKPELLTNTAPQVNPFKHRILEVFSEDGTGDMTFEQFLDMMSQMSSKV